MQDDVLSALALQAQEYRRAYRLEADSSLEVFVSNWKALELIEQYGSLQAAADFIFNPGTVRIIDKYWFDWCYETMERVNARLGKLHWDAYQYES